MIILHLECDHLGFLSSRHLHVLCNTPQTKRLDMVQAPRCLDCPGNCHGNEHVTLILLGDTRVRALADYFFTRNDDDT
jgi:hypothetical protein